MKTIVIRKYVNTHGYAKGGFKVGQLMVFLAKMGRLKIVCSRELPPIPLSVTVIKTFLE